MLYLHVVSSLKYVYIRYRTETNSYTFPVGVNHFKIQCFYSCVFVGGKLYYNILNYNIIKAMKQISIHRHSGRYLLSIYILFPNTKINSHFLIFVCVINYCDYN